jgi:hypothetical protein
MPDARGLSAQTAAQHSVQQGTDNCYQDYAQTNAEQLIRMLTSGFPDAGEPVGR